jgi:phosphatidate cytidylyltransferase
MILQISEFCKRFITSVGIATCFGGAYIHSVQLFSLLLLAILLFIILFEWPRLLVEFSKIHVVIITTLYPISPMLGLIYLNIKYHEIDVLLPLVPFFIAWVADTFGYLIGKKFGKHKICPSISPGKSWEGFIGSLFSVTIFNFFIISKLKVAFFFKYNSHYIVLFGTSFLLTTMAFLGGVFISVLKRRQNLKDTGCVLPGHGGFLDRFDSVFFTIITLWGLIALA